MTDDEPVREGWQAEGGAGTRKWHFIRGNTSLCRKFGFYFGELAPGGLKHSDSRDDCAECKRRVDAELAKAESKS